MMQVRALIFSVTTGHDFQRTVIVDIVAMRDIKASIACSYRTQQLVTTRKFAPFNSQTKKHCCATWVSFYV